MSCMEVYAVDGDGDVVLLTEFRNAWRGAMLVWHEIAKKYGVLNEWGYPDIEASWKLARTTQLTEPEWCTMVCTFDDVIIPREHFEYVARMFAAFPFDGHYRELAKLIPTLGPSIRGLCFNGTSVNENPWWVFGENEDDEGRPYNIDRDSKHWFFDPADRPHAGEVVP